MYRKNTKTVLLALSLMLSAGAHAEIRPNQLDNAQSKAIKPAAQTPVTSYSYAYSGPVYSRPYYPPNRQIFNNRNSHRISGRNNWFSDNRVRNWNRAMTNVISDMLGDGAGDFEFDMKIKFKAKGEGKGRGKSRANARANQRYGGYYQGNYQGRGNYYGRGHNYQYSEYGRYGNAPYAPPYSVYSAPSTYTSYPPLPATKSPSESKNIKAE
ncbi:MAG: hypothetical protein U9N50_02835 [Pseudomonadota bacterium]|nr:hypothetical protein [Pseudomonadota bacterium]